MTTGFGRKGLAIEVDDDLARRRAAFVASERARGTPDRPAYIETPAARALPAAAATKSLALAYILWFILGGISAHRFYLGDFRGALQQLGCLFFGGALVGFATATRTGFPGAIGAIAIVFGMLWILADVFLLPGVHRKQCQQPRPADVSAVFA